MVCKSQRPHPSPSLRRAPHQGRRRDPRILPLARIVELFRTRFRFCRVAPAFRGQNTRSQNWRLSAYSAFSKSSTKNLNQLNPRGPFPAQPSAIPHETRDKQGFRGRIPDHPPRKRSVRGRIPNRSPRKHTACGQIPLHPPHAHASAHAHSTCA